jgi:tetratricopeptide (TPR) repeat protein
MTWWWDTTHTLPEVVIFVSQDAWLGAGVADYYFDDGEFKEEYDIARAGRLYNMVLAVDPAIGWAWYQKGRIAFLHKDYETALLYLETFQELSDHPRPRAIYLKGVILGFMQQPEAALLSLQEYYKLDDSNWYIYNNLAWTYFQLGQFTQMDEISEAGLAKYPNNPWLLMNRSLAFFNLGQIEEAKEYINKSYEQTVLLTDTDWSTTYPGNDPLIASIGLVELLSIIEANKDLINKGG